jgi:signal transduction histidine kinase
MDEVAIVMSSMTSAESNVRRERERPSGTKAKLEVLLVEDNPADAELMLRALQKDGFEVSTTVVQSADEFHQGVKDKFPDVVLADYNLGKWRGVEVLEILHREGLDIPVIMVTVGQGEAAAVECMKQGATDYLLKNAVSRLPESVRRALQEKKLRAEKRAAEEGLAKKVQELARSNAELEQFAYVASHDLQEPLRMVATYTQLLAERYCGKLDESADKYIHCAVDGATRMQAMIQDLLSLSRAGRGENNVHRIDCNVVVELALKNLHAAIQESEAVVKCEGLPAVMANTIQLTQVFQNLIANAIKFHDAEPPAIQVGAEEKAGEWVFSVADNGIGIAAEHSEVIFAIFQRLHSRSEYPGNGIGLAICKKIVELHGGRIWLEPKEGRGAAFKFTLPAGDTAADGQQSPDGIHAVRV